MADRPNAVLRPATPEDVDDILQLMSEPASRGLILPRSRAEISSGLQYFTLAVIDGLVAGCVTRRDFGNGLVEIRSLVVDPDWQGMRLGSQLVQAAVKAAEDAGAVRIFALTYHPALFEYQGFSRVDKHLFPQKVWHDCAKCRKRDHCDEIAVLKCVR